MLIAAIRLAREKWRGPALEIDSDPAREKYKNHIYEPGARGGVRLRRLGEGGKIRAFATIRA
ncbi:MAG TPA: hypothetical protein VN728_08360 [Stellaceae bacterium]|jgi:hypothetical protein|nr:hypothetical protein [Stellaceae bacterium]